MNYLFVLGRDPELSLLELECYFEARNIEYKIIEYSREVALVSLPKLNFSRLIKELGGTIKIAEVFSDSGNLGEIEYSFNNMKIDVDKRLDYAISSYNSNLQDFIKEILKERFRKEKIKVFCKKPARKTDRFLTPSEIIDKKLIEKGLDIVVYKNNIAQTIVVFNPFEYQERDLKRPKKDFLKTTSLRIAKILVNLSYAKQDFVLLDPFSGTGTILQEALLNNINVIGIDIDQKSVDSSNENLKWLKSTYNTSKKFNIYPGDSTNMSHIIKTKVDAIVTEPYMGPFLKNIPSRQESEYIASKLRPIYTGFLIEAHKILKKEGKLVVIMPKFGDLLMDPLRLTDLFRIYSPRLSIKLPIPYILKNSIIERYIYVLEPK